jgi:hypothetical protein
VHHHKARGAHNNEPAHPICFELLPRGVSMNLNLSLTPIVSLIAGILILIVPRLLNYIVAFYLIAVGLIGLFGSGTLHLR